MSKKKVRVYAYQSGQIGFAPASERVPDGALVLAYGYETIVAPTVRGLARLAYDNETYLVPGCPEAQSDDEAFRAFMIFQERVRTALDRRPAQGDRRDSRRIQCRRRLDIVAP